MKKKIIILCAVFITLSITAFNVINKKASGIDALDTSETKKIAVNTKTTKASAESISDVFVYDIGPRFAPVKMETVKNATSIYDFIDRKNLQWMKTLKSVNLIIIEGERQSEIQAIGYTEDLTQEQIKILKAADYSSHFNIRAEFEEINQNTGILEDRHDSPHLTVVPEKQAKYSQGIKALKSFLRDNTMLVRAGIDQEKLQAAKLYFTVTKTGEIENARLDRTSNYPLLDAKMIELLMEAPGVWQPAEDIKGDKIDQELVVSFGSSMGC